jgi:hypothetical protein
VVVNSDLEESKGGCCEIVMEVLGLSCRYWFVGEGVHGQIG